MLRYAHHSDSSLAVVLIAAPIVFLLIWLFNAHRMGKFRKAKHSDANASLAGRKRRRALVLCGVLLILIAAGLLILFSK